MTNKNENKKKFLPIWAWAIVLVAIVLVLFFSITAMRPADGSELDYTTLIYIIRNLTAVLGLIIALLLRSHKALFVILIVRMVTDISDAISAYILDVEAIKPVVPMVVALLIVPALITILYLWKHIQKLLF